MTINLRSLLPALLCSALAALTLGLSVGEAGASPRTAPSPQAVSGLTTAQSAGSIVVSWSPPANARRSKLRAYRVVLANASSATTPTVRTARTRGTSVTISGLAAGRYSVRVVGIGPVKTGRTARTTATIPAVDGSTVKSLADDAPTESALGSAPTDFAAIPGPGTITLVWQAPATGGTPISAFQIRARSAGSMSWLAPTAVAADLLTRELTISGTSAWEFQIRAVSSIGAGAWSAIATAAPQPAA